MQQSATPDVQAHFMCPSQVSTAAASNRCISRRLTGNQHLYPRKFVVFAGQHAAAEPQFPLKGLRFFGRIKKATSTLIFADQETNEHEALVVEVLLELFDPPELQGLQPAKLGALVLQDIIGVQLQLLLSSEYSGNFGCVPILNLACHHHPPEYILENFATSGGARRGGGGGDSG